MKVKELFWDEINDEGYLTVADFYDEQVFNQLKFWQGKPMTPEVPKADAVNPLHYKYIAAGKQYMELMVDMLESKKGVEAHLFGQIYKYLMRCGSKDAEVQELKKAQWYLGALIKYKEEGKVI